MEWRESDASFRVAVAVVEMDPSHLSVDTPLIFCCFE